jgi:hypothetical protein
VQWRTNARYRLTHVLRGAFAATARCRWECRGRPQRCKSWRKMFGSSHGVLQAPLFSSAAGDTSLLEGSVRSHAHKRSPGRRCRCSPPTSLCVQLGAVVGVPRSPRARGRWLFGAKHALAFGRQRGAFFSGSCSVSGHSVSWRHESLCACPAPAWQQWGCRPVHRCQLAALLRCPLSSLCGGAPGCIMLVSVEHIEAGRLRSHRCPTVAAASTCAPVAGVSNIED